MLLPKELFMLFTDVNDKCTEELARSVFGQAKNNFHYPYNVKIKNSFVEEKNKKTNDDQVRHKSIVFEFSLCGIKKEDIELIFTDDSMILKVEPSNDDLKELYEMFLYKGISRKQSRFCTKFLRKMDFKNYKATFCNGMLEVEIPFDFLPSGDYRKVKID